MQGMLNRRYLRVKVLQALYAFESSNTDLDVGEKNMLKSINDIRDLYYYMLELVSNVVEMARRNMEQNKEKQLPTEEDLNPNLKFIENKIVAILEENVEFQRQVEARKISWAVESDNVKKLWRMIRDSEEYAEHMADSATGFQQDKEFLIKIFKQFIAEFEILHEYLEDRSIYWHDDLELVCINVVKTLNQLKQDTSPDRSILLDLYKDKEDDIKFVKDLYRRTILNHETLSELIDANTANWELERIAKLDVILMKMALCEMLYFSSIPVKVTLNEYVELAKNYSTPNSRMFVNGVLDKLAIQLKDEGKLVKTGRGLIE